MTEPALPVVRDSDSLADAFAAIKNRLGLSNEALDELAGFCKGHSDKLLGAGRVKRIGGITFDLLCSALCLEFVPRINLAALQKMEQRFEQRQTAQVRPAARVAKSVIERARPAVLSELARHASNARWQKYRERKAAEARQCAPAARPATSRAEQRTSAAA